MNDYYARPAGRHWKYNRWFIIVCLALAVGCSKNDRPPAYPTTVVVKDANGQPLAGARVTFRSVEHAIHARGVADDSGVCQMTTYERGDGAVAGSHQVAIGPPAMTGDPDAVQERVRVPRRLSSFDASQLEANVTDAGDANEFTFTVPAK